MIMPISTFIVVGIVVVSLISIVFYTAYDLGRTKERMEYEQRKSKATAQARFYRTRLDDSDIVKRLHDKFKR